MAASFAPRSTDRPVHGQSGYWDGLIDITLSGSYATGGDPLDLGPYTKRGGGSGATTFVQVEPVNGHTFYYDRTNKKLMVFTTAATQLPASAYPAALTAAPIRAYVRGG